MSINEKNASQQENSYHIKRRAKDRFVITPYELIDNRAVSPSAKMMWLYLHSNSDSFIPSLKTIAEMTGLSESTVKRAKKELVKMNLISIEEVGGRNGLVKHCLITNPPSMWTGTDYNGRSNKTEFKMNSTTRSTGFKMNPVTGFKMNPVTGVKKNPNNITREQNNINNCAEVRKADASPQFEDDDSSNSKAIHDHCDLSHNDDRVHGPVGNKTPLKAKITKSTLLGMYQSLFTYCTREEADAAITRCLVENVDPRVVFDVLRDIGDSRTSTIKKSDSQFARSLVNHCLNYQQST